MSLARRALPDERRRGWCPSLARPMPTGDGLLARVHPPLGILSLAQLRAVAEGARRFGNGHVDVTARANLQIRGVRDATAPALAAWLSAAGLGDARSDGGPQRLTLTSPLAGLDPAEAVDALALARGIEAAGRRIAGLPPKTLVVIEGPGTGGAEADIRLVPGSDGRVSINLGGDAREPAAIPDGDAIGTVAAILAAFAATGQRRMRDLPDGERRAMIHQAAERNPVSPAQTLILRCRSEAEASKEPSSQPRDSWRPPSRPLARHLRMGGWVGETGDALSNGFSLGGWTVLSVDAPFGRCMARMFDRLADASLAFDCLEIRLSPSRGFVLAGSKPDAARAALDRLAAAGFVTQPDDPRRAVAACPGAPACASGTTPVPDHAARLAGAFARFAARGLRAHVSGCAKGCAHPGAADLTLVAVEERYGVCIRGTPAAAPSVVLPFEAVLERVSRADPSRPLDEAFRT